MAFKKSTHAGIGRLPTSVNIDPMIRIGMSMANESRIVRRYLFLLTDSAMGISFFSRPSITFIQSPKQHVIPKNSEVRML